jgi:rhodanese-related sulfurtransferase
MTDPDEMDALLIDIREPYEWAAGRIPGSVHVPMDLLPEAAADLPRDRPWVMVCLGGVRAAFCAAALRDTGHDITVLEGGLRAWVAAGQPFEGTVAPHGQPGGPGGGGPGGGGQPGASST